MTSTMRIATVPFVVFVLVALQQPAHAQKAITVGNGGRER